MSKKIEKEDISTLKETYQKIKETIYEKEYIREITITSVILWGGFQVIYLMLMSPFYLRFFSVSQMISDSIFVILSYGIVIFIYDFIKSINNDNTSESKLLKLQISLGLISMPILFYILHRFDFIEINLPTFNTFSSKVFLIFLIYIYVLLVINIFQRYSFPKIKKIIKRLWFKKMSPLHPRIKEELKYLKGLWLILLWIIVLNILHSELSIPWHFTNQNNICIEKVSEDCKIRYFNDKYIFIERQENKIEIIKFDKFFK